MYSINICYLYNANCHSVTKLLTKMDNRVNMKIELNKKNQNEKFET